MNLLGYHVLTVDIIGYGETNDKLPSQELLNKDIISSINYLHSLWPEETKLIWAHSLATGLLSCALKDVDQPIDGIILEAPIKSLIDCMQEWRFLSLFRLVNFDGGIIGRLLLDSFYAENLVACNNFEM